MNDLIQKVRGAGVAVYTLSLGAHRFMRETGRRGKRTLDSLRDRMDEMGATRMSLRDQTFFSKRLSFLISAGVPVVECLHILKDQARSRGHSIMLSRIIADASNGQSLAKSFGKFPKIFSEFSLHIIRVGETSGTLSQNLGYLSNELKKRQALRRKVIGAFIYPAIVTVAMLGITVFLMVYLFPKILPIFASLNAKLPFTTRTVIALSDFFRLHGILIVLAIVALSAGYALSLRHVRPFRSLMHRAMLRVPGFGMMIQYYNVANASRTLGLLLKSGLTLSEALPITSQTSTNLAYRREFAILGEAVLRGEKISTHLTKQRALFPDIFGHMIAVGERSGSLAETLVYLSELYEAEVDDFTKNLSTLVEPALMVMMGVLVGFIAVSIITPIYGITQNLHA